MLHFGRELHQHDSTQNQLSEILHSSKESIIWLQSHGGFQTIDMSLPWQDNGQDVMVIFLIWGRHLGDVNSPSCLASNPQPLLAEAG